MLPPEVDFFEYSGEKEMTEAEIKKQIERLQSCAFPMNVELFHLYKRLDDVQKSKQSEEIKNVH